MVIQRQEAAANEYEPVSQRKEKYTVKAILLNLLAVWDTSSRSSIKKTGGIFLYAAWISGWENCMQEANML